MSIPIFTCALTVQQCTLYVSPPLYLLFLESLSTTWRILYSCSAFQDSEENTEQRNWERNFRALVDDRRRARYIAAQEAGKDLSAAELEDDTQRNQFNYTERAVQTFNTLIKTRIMGTTPPETTNQCGSVSQWQIYDAYKAELKQLQLSTDMEKASREAKASRESEANADEKSKGATKSTNPVHSEEMGEKLAILERIAVQNAEDDTYSDFRYYESPADPFVSTGSALPLWQFADPRTRRKQVTAITWNPVHQDLFAVAYGSYDFMRQGSGMIACYTLKNVGHPEYSFQCESGVMSLAFHPTIPSLLAAGCYDGSVRVYDIRKREARPVFECDGRFGKHSDPVWGVYWEPSSSDRNPTFYSISGDGHVGAWSLQKRELHMEVVMTLKLGHGPAPGTTSDTPNPAPSPAMAAGSAVAAVAALQQTSAVAGGGDSPPLGESLKNGTTTLAKFGELTDINNATGLAGGSCFDFSPFHPNIYLVGTEEGAIHTCNLETTGQYIASYIGHSMAVYSVRWNVFHPRIFMSCSADWTIKIWDTTRVNAVMSIDMGTAVGDCAWAPYSSTVFAAVTDHGRLNVWDLNANKHDFICDQPVRISLASSFILATLLFPLVFFSMLLCVSMNLTCLCVFTAR